MLHVQLIVVSVLLLNGVHAGPNILYMIADDMSAEFDMPKLNSIVSGKDKNGRKFSNAHATYTVCGPSRTSFLTGLYPDQTGAYRFADKRPDLESIPYYLSKKGYYTASFGKVFHQPYSMEGDDTYREHFNVRGPNGRSAQAYYFDANWECKGKAYCVRKRGEKTSDMRVTRAALRFIEEYQNKTWAAFVGFYRPHFQLAVPDNMVDVNYVPELDNDTEITNRTNLNFYECKDLKKQEAYFTRMEGRAGSWEDITGEKGRESSADLNKAAPDTVKRIKIMYQAAVRLVDKQIGEILATLKRLDLYDKTIIVFHSDHGWQMGRHGIWCKNTLYDQATRVPLYLRVPDSDIQAKSTDTVSLVDIFPTLRHAIEGDSYKPVEIHQGSSLLMPLQQDRMVYTQYPRCNQRGSIQTHNCMDNYFDTCSSVPSIKYMGYSAHSSDVRNIYNAILWKPFLQQPDTHCIENELRTPSGSRTMWNKTSMDPMFTINDEPESIDDDLYRNMTSGMDKVFSQMKRNEWAG